MNRTRFQIPRSLSYQTQKSPRMKSRSQDLVFSETGADAIVRDSGSVLYQRQEQESSARESEMADVDHSETLA